MISNRTNRTAFGDMRHVLVKDSFCNPGDVSMPCLNLIATLHSVVNVYIFNLLQPTNHFRGKPGNIKRSIKEIMLKVALIEPGIKSSLTYSILASVHFSTIF